jgi:hypothetical protein
MYVWEMLAYRLRNEGWSLWHAVTGDTREPEYVVHFSRPGIAGQADGPTLTDAYAEAARQARKLQKPVPAASPHLVFQGLGIR